MAWLRKETQAVADLAAKFEKLVSQHAALANSHQSLQASHIALQQAHMELHAHVHGATVTGKAPVPQVGATHGGTHPAGVKPASTAKVSAGAPSNQAAQTALAASSK